jgi:hypothetical protein
MEKLGIQLAYSISTAEAHYLIKVNKTQDLLAISQLVSLYPLSYASQTLLRHMCSLFTSGPMIEEDHRHLPKKEDSSVHCRSPNSWVVSKLLSRTFRFAIQRTKLELINGFR